MRWLSFASLLITAGWAGLASGDPLSSSAPPMEESTEDESPPADPALDGNEMSPSQWLRVTSRMEGASADIADVANQLASTATDIEEAGRLSRLTQLSGLATNLDHRVIQARLAADQLIQP